MEVNFWVYFQGFLLKMMASNGFHEYTVYFTICFPIVMKMSPEIQLHKFSNETKNIARSNQNQNWTKKQSKILIKLNDYVYFHYLFSR